MQFPVGSKVKCINNSGAKDCLILDKIYIVLSSTPDDTKICDSGGYYNWWSNFRFVKQKSDLVKECALDFIN